MIRTSITPQQADIHISVPPQYIGKKLEVLLYAIDEVESPAETSTPSVMAQFWGILSDETAQDILQRSEASRAEWDSNS